MFIVPTERYYAINGKSRKAVDCFQVNPDGGIVPFAIDSESMVIKEIPAQRLISSSAEVAEILNKSLEMGFLPKGSS